jgi:tetratricopeptide (TPR) repeat protein
MKKTISAFLLTGLIACAQAAAQQLDFGDHTSATITTKAWESLNSKNYTNAVSYTKKCIELYEKQAVEMQKSLKEPVPNKDKDAVSKLWALNDVGTCLFIMGQALEKQEKGKEALASYKELLEKVPFAQCWDTKGWFWKPADAAKSRVKALEFDTLK